MSRTPHLSLNLVMIALSQGAILAFFGRPSIFLWVWGGGVAISTKKEEVIQELEDRQVEDWSPEQTVLELKALLSAVRRMSDQVENPLKGLTTMKLADLQETYREEGLGDPGEPHERPAHRGDPPALDRNNPD